MCAVSAITDYGMKQWPDWNLWQGLPIPAQPVPPTITKPDNIVVDYKKYMELVKKAEEYDKITGQPDCIDPEKDKFLQALIKRIEVLEAKNIHKNKYKSSATNIGYDD